MKWSVFLLGLLFTVACASKKAAPVNETAEKNKSDGTSSDGKDNYHEKAANHVVDYTTKTENKRLRRAEKRRRKFNKAKSKEASAKQPKQKKSGMKPPTL